MKTKEQIQNAIRIHKEMAKEYREKFESFDGNLNESLNLKAQYERMAQVLEWVLQP
jgi:hypothetical protein